MDTILFILKVAAGSFIGIAAYRLLIGFPGPTETQLQWIGNHIEEIVDRLPDDRDSFDD